METGAITENIDVAQVVLYAFWIFFAGLIWYLRQEDRREGYPLEDDTTGRYNKDPWLFVPSPKTFQLAHGRGTFQAPDLKRDTREMAAKRVFKSPGYPYVPTGDPLKAGVGPGSWAERADHPDVNLHGEPIIVPMRLAKDFTVAGFMTTDPRGMRVIGCDKKVAGTVADIWVDRAEHLARYLEVRLDDEAGTSVLVPMNFCVIKGMRGSKVVYVHAITAEQFAGVPKLKKKRQITLLEEEKIVAYFGAGQLYATPERQESIL